MSAEDRRSISNGIWLCRNCHKLIDGDATAFDAALLFEWRRAHESSIGQKMGRTSQDIRDRLNERALTPFRNFSYLAQQIVLDKPDHWEYRLTAELLRDLLHPILLKWRSLEGGHYAFRGDRISADEFIDWHSDNLSDIGRQTHALDCLLNEAVPASWGKPGEPGSETEILRTCRLVADAAERMLEWEERVQFAFLPSAFRPIQDVFKGVAGRQLEQLFLIPEQISAVFTQKNPSGLHVISIQFSLPDDWADLVNETLTAAMDEHFS